MGIDIKTTNKIECTIEVNLIEILSLLENNNIVKQTLANIDIKTNITWKILDDTLIIKILGESNNQ